MKNFLCLLAFAGAFFIAPGLKAGTEMDHKSSAIVTAPKPVEATPLDLFKFEEGYVFESVLSHGGSLGEQDERPRSSTDTGFACAETSARIWDSLRSL